MSEQDIETAVQQIINNKELVKKLELNRGMVYDFKHNRRTTDAKVVLLYKAGALKIKDGFISK